MNVVTDVQQRLPGSPSRSERLAGQAAGHDAAIAQAIADFRPIQMVEIELSIPLVEVTDRDAATGTVYQGAWVFVRLHDAPIGLVKLDLAVGSYAPAAVATAIWQELAGPINAHLVHDGLPALTALDEQGVPMPTTPPCLADRAAFLIDPPFISVIIPTRERPERLEKALRSILAGDYPVSRYEILVVDNAPETEKTFMLVMNLHQTFPNLRYARENRPGSASARNRGLEVISGDIVAFTDDDVIADAHWLTEVARGFEAAPAVGAVSGLLLPMELATAAQYWFEQYGGFSRGYRQRIFNLTDHRTEDRLYPYAAGIFGTGNNMAFRRCVLEAIGAFDPGLGNGTPALGGVDSEVLLRTIVRGHTLVYQPSAIVHHLHRREYEGLRRQIYSYGVGLTAYLVKTLWAHPRLIPDFLKRLPAGLFFALSPRSDLNANKQQGYPSELTWLERRGMLYGPLAYLKSRRKFGPHPVTAHP